jgi:hypothetical protein
MKIEQLLVKHLYSHKKLSLEGIGSFYFATDNSHPEESESALPPDGINFECNHRETKDESLIDTIATESKKIRSLAASDLESYTLLSKQFLQIGKPLYIKGIGVLRKTQDGMYTFAQEDLNNPQQTEQLNTSVIKENSDFDFSSASKKIKQTKWVPLVLILAVICALVFFYLYYNISSPSVNNINKEDTTNLILPATDTIPAKDTILPAASSDSSSFAIILKTFTDSSAAKKSFQKLSGFGHQVILTQKDSGQFLIEIPVTRPLSDSMIVLDSLRKIFGKNIRLKP